MVNVFHLLITLFMGDDVMQQRTYGHYLLDYLFFRLH
jgi:hypothetical protein